MKKLKNKHVSVGIVREFNTGSSRDTDEGKLDFDGFLDPCVLKTYAQYMSKHMIRSDGKSRTSDDWKKGIPQDVYMKSGFRHFHDWWSEHHGHKSREGLIDALCAVIFNASGYLYEELRKKETVQ